MSSGTRGAQRQALSNGYLVRYTLAVLFNVVGEWTAFIAFLIYAFDRGGSTATGFAAIALTVPFVVFAPLAGALAERHPAGRVRLGAMVLQTVAWTVAAFAAYADADIVFVVAAGVVASAAVSTLGPAGAVIRPAIVRSSMELTIANLWAGYAEGASVLIGPLLATVALHFGGAPAALAAGAGAGVLGLAVSLIRRPIDPPGGTDASDRLGALALMRRGIRDVRARPGVIGVMAVAGGQFFVVGALDIVIVVAAETELDLGPAGPGLLNAAFGAGAIASVVVATLVVTRRRLAPVLATAMLLSAIAATVLGFGLSVVVAFAVLPFIGLMRSLQDLLGQILLQRSADPKALASVFAVLELSGGIGLISGSLAAQILIAIGGVKAALFGIGAYFTLLLAVTARSLRIADASADVPVVAISLLRRIPVFEPLPRAALEAVARSSIEVPVAEGTDVIRQGEAGDRFYAVADGTYCVSVDGNTVQEIERGGSFGELALLADVPRAATVTATTSGSLLAVERRPFLVAVTGHDSSRQAAWGVMHRIHGADAPVDGPDEFAKPHTNGDGSPADPAPPIPDDR